MNSTLNSLLDEQILNTRYVDKYMFVNISSLSRYMRAVQLAPLKFLCKKEMHMWLHICELIDTYLCKCLHTRSYYTMHDDTVLNRRNFESPTIDYNQSLAKLYIRNIKLRIRIQKQLVPVSLYDLSMEYILNYTITHRNYSIVDDHRLVLGELQRFRLLNDTTILKLMMTEDNDMTEINKLRTSNSSFLLSNQLTYLIIGILKMYTDYYIMYMSREVKQLNVCPTCQNIFEFNMYINDAYFKREYGFIFPYRPTFACCCI